VSVTYEVNLKVQKPIQKDFEHWLVSHIDDVLAIDGFESAHWYEVNQDSASAEVHWTVLLCASRHARASKLSRETCTST
jgi:hypothetical protein